MLIILYYAKTKTKKKKLLYVFFRTSRRSWSHHVCAINQLALRSENGTNLLTFVPLSLSLSISLILSLSALSHNLSLLLKLNLLLYFFFCVDYLTILIRKTQSFSCVLQPRYMNTSVLKHTHTTHQHSHTPSTVLLYI